MPTVPPGFSNQQEWRHWDAHDASRMLIAVPGRMP